MQPVITAAQAGEWDARSLEPVNVLMQRAGLAVAIAAAQTGAGYGSRVSVLAGPGNNGGDGYVAARYLVRRGAAVEVIALAPPRTDACRWAAEWAARGGVVITPWRSPKEGVLPDLLVDAVFGAGFRGALPDDVVPWTGLPVPVVAVDVPSGLDATTGAVEGATFAATRTVTFGALKVGHLVGVGPDVCGLVTVVDIGLEPGPIEFSLCQEADAPRPTRPRTGHKWSVGTVMLVGGSPGLAGAPWLAARSALTAGAGSVRVVLPAMLERAFPGPELMTLGVGSGERFRREDASAILEAAARFDVLVVGPGLGPDQEGLLGGIIEGRTGSLLIDADGLGAIGDPGRLASRPGPTVLTPHAGEFRRLTGADPTHAAAADLAQATGAVVLLKGTPTFVAGEELWAVTTGGRELATIGTGDVLTGMVAAFWARGLEPEAAARSAAYWHGMAGAASRWRGTVTSDGLAEEVARWAWPG